MTSSRQELPHSTQHFTDFAAAPCAQGLMSGQLGIPPLSAAKCRQPFDKPKLPCLLATWQCAVPVPSSPGPQGAFSRQVYCRFTADRHHLFGVDHLADGQHRGLPPLVRLPEDRPQIRPHGPVPRQVCKTLTHAIIISRSTGRWQPGQHPVAYWRASWSRGARFATSPEAGAALSGMRSGFVCRHWQKREPHHVAVSAARLWCGRATFEGQKLIPHRASAQQQ